MNDALINVSTFSIFIPAIISLFRVNHYDRAYAPFVFFIWLGCANEVLSRMLIMYDYHTMVNNNIYVLLGSLLIILFFQKMGLFKRKPMVPVLLALFYVSVWLSETFLLRSIHELSSYFRIVFSLTTVLLSISLINILLVESGNLLKEGSFWICTGFTIQFTLKVLVEIFWLYGITNKEFQLEVFNILLFANIFTNLTYALATLWMNRKKPYSLQW
jgi:hypothetical protein